MAFMDIYPVGHQAGVSMIMHGKRIATNGDLRFEPPPGQWQAVPKQLDRTLDEKSNTITTKLCYPDKDQHLNGFNPLLYPDFEFTYEVKVHGEGGHIVVSGPPCSGRIPGKIMLQSGTGSSYSVRETLEHG